MIDRAGLEIRYTPFGYRGFESLTFRQNEMKEGRKLPSFCVYTHLCVLILYTLLLFYTLFIIILSAQIGIKMQLISHGALRAVA